MDGIDTLLLSRAEAAKQLGWSARQLYRMEKSGTGPPTLRIGRLPKYPASALRAWVERNTSTAAMAK